MPTLYVSNDASNGYAIGNDANSYADAQGKGKPWLTPIHAFANAVNGDTIKVNDGTYRPNTYINVLTPNLTLLPENDYGVLIQDDGTLQTSQILMVRPTGTGFVCGKVVLDAESNHSSNIQASIAGTPPRATFNGTWLKGATYQPVQCQYALFNFQGCIIEAAGAVGQVVYWEPHAAGQTLTMEDCQVSLATSAAAVQAVRIVTATAQAAALILHRNRIAVTSSDPAAILHGVLGSGITTLDIERGQFRFTSVGAGQQVHSISIPSFTGRSVSSCTILDNEISADSTLPAAGHGIVVGDDDDALPAAGRDTISGVSILGNTVTNVNHGILTGWLTNTLVAGNTLDTVVIGVIGKHTVACEFHRNTIAHLAAGGGGALRAKGSQDDVFEDNLFILTPGWDGPFMQADTTSVRVAYRRNMAAAWGLSPSTLALVNANSSASFSGNNYWSSLGPISGTPFSSGGASLALAAWIAAHESDAAGLPPALWTPLPTARLSPVEGLRHDAAPDTLLRPHLGIAPWRKLKFLGQTGNTAAANVVNQGLGTVTLAALAAGVVGTLTITDALITAASHLLLATEVGPAGDATASRGVLAWVESVAAGSAVIGYQSPGAAMANDWALHYLVLN